MSFNYCKRKPKFVSVSQGFVHEFIEKYPSAQHKILYIYNPLNIEQIQSLLEQRTLHVDSPYFVAVQRLNAFDKDGSTVIRGFALFKRKHPEYSLVVVGDGPQYEKFKRLAASEVGDESIIFTGQLNNPYPMIRSAQALILSSTLTVGEGLPTVLIEAQVLGVPAVSSDVPSGPAEILMHGEAGYLFEAENPESLAQVLEDIERHPEEREKKICKATENLVRFSPSEAISRLEEIIETAFYK